MMNTFLTLFGPLVRVWLKMMCRRRLPHLQNPSEGFIVAANNRITTQGASFQILQEHCTGDRALRITELIKARGSIDVSYTRKMQYDPCSPTARTVCSHLHSLETDEPELAADLGEEAKNAAKTITWGIILGIIIPVVLYTLSALVSTAILPWEEFANSDAPYAAVASKYMGPFGITFIVIVAWAAILSSHNGEQAVGARILFGLSRDKIIGGKLTAINKFGVPGFALIATFIVAVFLIVSGTIQLVAEIIVAMFLYNWIVTHIAVIISRFKYPDMYNKMPKGYKGAFIIIPILGIIVSGYLLILQGWKALLFAAVWMAVGAIVYFVRYAQKKEEISKLITEWPRDRYFE